MGPELHFRREAAAIYPKTDVQEWFEYEGGRPYHFKLYIDLSNETGSEARPWHVLEKVNFYKSLRSHLDRLEFTIQPKDPSILRLGGCAAAHIRSRRTRSASRVQSA